MKNIILTLSFFTWLISIGCKEDKLQPVENDGVPPSAIQEAKAESLPGAVKITYTVPSDPDLLYIMATYTNASGRTFEAKASYYTNTVTLEGFADTLDYEAKVYAVDRGENKSAPYTLTVRCKKPPKNKAFEQLTVERAFGGIDIKTFNKDESDLAIVLLHKDSLGFFVITDTYYTKRDTIIFKARGYDSLLNHFGIYVRDRWNNISDTLFEDISPIYEAKLDKTKFKEVTLPGDAHDGYGLPMPNLWDTKIAENSNMWHSDGNQPMPIRITFDLGVTAKLSRFIVYERPGQYLYTHANPKIYEVYGSNSPDPDGGWTNWTLMNHCVSKKPSGNPQGSNSAEDIAAAAAGEQWEVPLSIPKVRYIRVKILQTWAGGTAGHIAEMTFYGNDK